MKSLNDTSLSVWRVKLGNDYYVQGEENGDLLTLEFTPDPSAAWLFQIEEAADFITEICSGSKEKIQINSMDSFILTVHRIQYLSDKNRDSASFYTYSVLTKEKEIYSV